MSETTHIIEFASAIVTTVIGCQTSGGLDKATINKRIQILGMLGKEFGVPGLQERIPLLLNAANGEELSTSLFKLVNSIERELVDIDSSGQNIGSYFFVSAEIELESVWLDYQLNRTVKEREVLVDAPFARRARYLSTQIGIEPPEVALCDLSDNELIFAKEMLRTWKNVLIAHAKAKDALRSSSGVPGQSVSREGRAKLVIRGLIRGIPYVGDALDALFFGK